jgi:endonuclease YncB( thermonuclease family)
MFNRLSSLSIRLALVPGMAIPLAGPVAAAPFEGPVAATVLRVLDGDTFLAEAEVWPGQFIRVNVRIRGIDAPEMKARCVAERDLARAARGLLSDLLGSRVRISNISGAKYFGRVLADVSTPSEDDVSRRMIERGAVRPYDGGRRRSWCG